MPHNSDENHEMLYHKLIALAQKQLPEAQSKLVTQFIYQYYATVALSDLLEHDVADLYGALISHWNLCYQRAPGEVKLKVYNPQFEQHGWQSTHSIIEICCDDKPFLVDSIQLELNRRGFTSHMVIHVGGLQVKRDDKNRITEIYPPAPARKDSLSEAVIFFEIDRQSETRVLKELETSIAHILEDVRLAISDWQAMLHQVEVCLQELTTNPPPVDKEELEETKDFLRWIASNHFTFLGYREYVVDKTHEGGLLRGLPETSLGVLRRLSTHKRTRSFAQMTPEAREHALSKKSILIIAKTNTKSTIHRPAYTDYIGIKVFNAAGEIVGEKRFIGLYTSAAYNRSPRDIPLLRRKVQQVLEDSELSLVGHAGKALINILETLPRDDLFQADADELLTLAMGILHLQERRRIKIFIRKDIYGRFISCLFYIPRDKYNTELRIAVQDILMNAFHGIEVSFATLFSESVLARIHYMIRVDPSEPLTYDIDAIEKKIIEVSRTWQDVLCDTIKENNGEERGNWLINRYQDAFPAGYREANDPRTAVYDISHIEHLTKDNTLNMSLFKPLTSVPGHIRFKLYTLGHAIPLSDVIPILENMGLRVLGEEPYCITMANDTYAWISDFNLVYEKSELLTVDSVKDIFQEAFASVWHNKTESDGFNHLVLSALLNWREIAVLRAYTEYFRQIGITFSQQYIAKTLTKYPQIAADLIKLFKLRFDPKKPATENHQAELERAIQTAIDEVDSLDEDRILKNFCNIIKSTLRTNFFQKDHHNNYKEYLSFKLSPEHIHDMPLPKPMFEVFVFSTRVIGVHLRGGKVARGGLRWSDRPEDFRTEVLGLMKAQKVKNAVIVPTGAKGGFVPKSLPLHASREDLMKEVVAVYKVFISGLLDLTDNVVNGTVVPPLLTVRYDEDDPYLVVAADKGTATFSNYANEVAKEYGFWLDDAFASGGATGYDHKKLGITARGAWESVNRHFRDLGLNAATQDFTVVGIGDMAGDVFGNGMLLSHHIRLVGAFNHQHIFIDPSPDAASSFNERERLFHLPRSSWADYDISLISKGGGVFNRAAKSIVITPEMATLLGTEKAVMTPNELIVALLKTKVDLLWNGGIGTFAKASYEQNSEVGDKTNDAIRVNGKDLTCQAVVEGGNLGLTQLARVEYALNGGVVYTDFIDNSAGVDCSDHEVNIKILLNKIVLDGDITEKQRNQLLAEMADDVAKLVLRDNYGQTQAIGIAAAQAHRNVDIYARFIASLESSGRLNRALEFLPDDKELLERKSIGKGLTPPEIAILLAYSKSALKDDILNSDVPEDPYLSCVITSAFPAVLHEKYPQQMQAHILRREIIATQLSNAIINDMGITFVYRVNEETGASVASIVRAYRAAYEVFKIDELWARIESLDYKVPSFVQIDMMLSVGSLIRRATRWFLSNYRRLDDIPAIVASYSEGVEKLFNDLPQLLVGTAKELLEGIVMQYVHAGVPEDTASRVASTMAMFSVLDIIAAANEYNFPIEDVARVYFTLGASLDLAWLRAQILQQSADTHWESLAKAAFRDDIDWQQRELTVGVLQHSPQASNIEECIEIWSIAHKPQVERWQRLITELRSSGTRQYVMLAVAIRALLDLTQASIQTVKQLKKVEGNHAAT